MWYQKLTPIQRDALQKDLIRRELDNQKLYTNFFLNPKKPAPYVTEKPTSFVDDPDPEEKIFLEAMCKYNQDPVNKYKFPVTSSMDYGWICDHTVLSDRMDSRFNFPKRKTDMFLYMQPKKFEQIESLPRAPPAISTKTSRAMSRQLYEEEQQQHYYYQHSTQQSEVIGSIQPSQQTSYRKSNESKRSQQQSQQQSLQELQQSRQQSQQLQSRQQSEQLKSSSKPMEAGIVDMDSSRPVSKGGPTDND